MPRIYVALDLEFTGLNPEHDAILEVGAVKFRGDEILDTWACLINPGRALSPKVERLTGITRNDIERAPSFNSLIPSLGRFVGENPIVGHTVWLDMQFLQRGGMRLPNPTLDTFELASILIPYAARYSLAQLARELGIEYATKHRALEDAKATHQLFIALLDRAAQLNPKTIQEIARVSAKSDWSLRFVWQDIQRDAARNAFGGGSIGAQLKAKGVAQDDEQFGVLFSRNKEARPLKAKTTKTQLDTEALEALISPSGLFEKDFPNFEYRAEQVEMLRAVSNAFNDSGVLLVEAGTGTGKCLQGDARITFKNGAQKTIQEICESAALPRKPILCVAPSGKMTWQKIIGTHKNGVRAVWHIQTALGRSIKATANHPFMTLEGWAALADLQVGDRIATLRRLPAGAAGFPSHEVFVAGAMLGDGSCVHLDGLSFTNFDPDVVAAVRQAVAQLGNVRMTDAQKKGRFGFRRETLLGHRRSGLSLLLEKLGIAGHAAPAKQIPDPYFQANTESLCHLLSGLWITDGCVEKRDGHLSFSSASHQMILEVQHLLLKLGIIARVRYKRVKLNGKLFDSWHMMISDMESKRAFRGTIGEFLVGEKKARLEKWWDTHANQKFNPNDDLIPLFAWTLIDAARQRAGKSWYAIRHECIIASDRKREISRAKMRAIGEFLGSPELTEIATTDLYWDRIVSIEPAGQAPTFDLTMEGEPNFVANDIVVHNSLAYLLPAIQWASQNNDRVVVSTNTINLQDQLSQKDIPAIQHVLPLDFKFTVLKGRSNYLCLRRFDALRRQDSHTPDEIRVLAKILAWLPSTTTGDMAELTFTPQELKVWARLASDPEHCTTERCANRPDKCFFFRARERADSAHLVIVNHALLLSDMALENRVLPEFQYLIIDEAHHLEARATDALAFDATRSSIDILLRQIAGERTGLIHNLGTTMRHSKKASSARDFQSTLDQIERDALAAGRAAYGMFDALERFLAQQQDGGGEGDGGGGDKQFRLTPSRRTQQGWSNVEIEWDQLATKFLTLTEGLEKIYRAWQELENAELAGYADLLQDIMAAQRRVRETHSALERIVIKPAQSDIYWASVNRQTSDIGLHAAPLHVGDMLHKNLFATRETVILTSATMSIGGSFNFIENRLGIGEWADHLMVGSPFDFEQAALVYVPNDMPEPGQQGYQKAIETALGDLLLATRGRALVLFTSHSQLQTTYRALARKLEQDDVLVLAQGLDGSRRQVLDTFKTQERMALFGTKSFWEGIDVVGEALSCLAMTRLPFNVPSDPIFAARSETFDDPFGQYAVPEAVLRFRQGFGRLIRSKSDRGVVAILDKRVLTKNYGRLFLESLPKCTRLQGPLKELPKRAAGWIDDIIAKSGE